MKTEHQLDTETQPKTKETPFNSFYKKWGSVLINYAQSYLKDSEASISLVHDIIINFRSKEVNADNIQAYLFKSVRNASLNLIESRKRKPVKVTDPQELILISDRAQQTINIKRESEQLLLLQRFISQLPEKRQLVFRMHRFEGYSYAEIAEQLNISTRTVEDHLAKSMSFLHEHMQHLLNQ